LPKPGVEACPKGDGCAEEAVWNGFAGAFMNGLAPEPEEPVDPAVVLSLAISIRFG
jgi:hypothetical protein